MLSAGMTTGEGRAESREGSERSKAPDGSEEETAPAMSNAMDCSSMEDHGHHLADMGGRKRMTLRSGSQPVKHGKTTQREHLSEFYRYTRDSGAF